MRVAVSVPVAVPVNVAVRVTVCVGDDVPGGNVGGIGVTVGE